MNPEEKLSPEQKELVLQLVRNARELVLQDIVIELRSKEMHDAAELVLAIK